MALNLAYHLFGLLAFHLPLEVIVARLLILKFFQHLDILLRDLVLGLFMPVAILCLDRKSVSALAPFVCRRVGQLTEWLAAGREHQVLPVLLNPVEHQSVTALNLLASLYRFIDATSTNLPECIKSLEDLFSLF